MNTRILTFFVGLVVMASAAQAQMPVMKVIVEKARMMEAVATMTLVGTVEPARRAGVCTEIAGLVVEMSAREGDRVEAGQVLCKLNDDLLRLRLDESNASLAALSARLSELQAGTRPEDIARLQSLHTEAIAELERWQFEMSRVEGLRKGHDANEKEYVETRASFLSAQAREAAAKASYALAVKGPRSEVIARAEAEVAEQRAIVAQARINLAKASIRAPFAGYVSRRVAEVGEWITLGGQTVELVELASVLVRVDVPEKAFQWIQIGGKVRVEVDALGRSFGGVVKHIVRQADPAARTFPVDVEVDNAEEALAAGMFARATVPSGPGGQRIAVPKDAIVEKKGIAHVAMVMPGRGGMNGMLIAVTVGADIGDWISITSDNVYPGMTVVTRGTEFVLPFPNPILIVDENGTPVATPAGGSHGEHGGGGSHGAPGDGAGSSEHSSSSGKEGKEGA